MRTASAYNSATSNDYIQSRVCWHCVRVQAKWRDPEYRGKILTALRNPSYQDKRVASQRVRVGSPKTAVQA